jgi:hypothetical protein
LALSVSVALTLTLALAPRAAADGDPASDVLYTGTLFVPYEGVPARAQGELARTLAVLRRGHYPLSVALISSRSDLGAVPQAFGKPQQYAQFLEAEISADRRRPLLIVMPNGYGAAAVPQAAAASLQTLPPPARSTGAALARSALAAITVIVSALPHASAGGPPWLLIGVLTALALGTLALVAAARGARRLS